MHPSAAALPRCLSTFRAIRSLKHPALRPRDFTGFGCKTSYHSLNRGPAGFRIMRDQHYQIHDKEFVINLNKNNWIKPNAVLFIGVFWRYCQNVGIQKCRGLPTTTCCCNVFQAISDFCMEAGGFMQSFHHYFMQTKTPKYKDTRVESRSKLAINTH